MENKGGYASVKENIEAHRNGDLVRVQWATEMRKSMEPIYTKDLRGRGHQNPHPGGSFN